MRSGMQRACLRAQEHAQSCAGPNTAASGDRMRPGGVRPSPSMSPTLPIPSHGCNATASDIAQMSHFQGDPSHSFMMWNPIEGAMSAGFRPFIIPFVGLTVAAVTHAWAHFTRGGHLLSPREPPRRGVFRGVAQESLSRMSLAGVAHGQHEVGTPGLGPGDGLSLARIGLRRWPVFPSSNFDRRAGHRLRSQNRSRKQGLSSTSEL